METTKIELNYESEKALISILHGDKYNVFNGFIGREKSPTYSNWVKVENQKEYDETLELYKTKINEILRHRHERKIERKQSRQAQINKFRVQLVPGEILTDSWGYEQTNVEFYEILKVNAKGTKITIRELAHKTVEGSEYGHGMACEVLPAIGCYVGEPEEKRVNSDNIKICESIRLSLWDGRPKYKSWYY